MTRRLLFLFTRLITGWIVLCFPSLAFAQLSIKMTLPPPQDFGKVVIGNHSEKAGLARVEFEHWLHRSLYTCRLCHVDIGFAMKAGATGITAADNIRGAYCGTCHRTGGQAFASCTPITGPIDKKKCDRCHSRGGNGTRTHEYKTFTASFPKDRYSKGVDWEKTEQQGLITMTDYVEGPSQKRKALPVRKDFELRPEKGQIPDIIFSHKKHVVWNGCELCHPDLFGVNTGETKYDMDDMFNGRYCGACHGRVAFILMECNRCHKKPVL